MYRSKRSLRSSLETPTPTNISIRRYPLSHLQGGSTSINKSLGSYLETRGPRQTERYEPSPRPVLKTGGNRPTIKTTGTAKRTLNSNVNSSSEQFMCIVENRARQVGICSFSLFTGTVLLTEFNDNCIYDIASSLALRLNPQLIIMQDLAYSRFLKKKIEDMLPNSTIKLVKSTHFNEVKGEEIYKRISGNTPPNARDSYLSLAALNAMYECFMYENNIEEVVKLTLQHIKMDDFVLLTLPTLINLSVIPIEEKTGKNNEKVTYLSDCFDCCTFGGSRLLRGCLLQPSKDMKLIHRRQSLLTAFLKNYHIPLEIQKSIFLLRNLGLKNMKNFDNIAMKVLCLDEEVDIENVELYGNLLIDLLSVITHISQIKTILADSINPS